MNDSPVSWSLNDDTKILTKTDTETFFQDQIFPKPKPILFFRDQIFRNRDFFPTPNIPKPRPNFFETETETFLPKQNFAKPKPSKKWQKFRNREVSKPKSQSLLCSDLIDQLLSATILCKKRVMSRRRADSVCGGARPTLSPPGEGVSTFRPVSSACHLKAEPLALIF